MSDNTSLGDRMKKYELSVGTTLLPRTPAIIRVDGKAFHTFTRKLTVEVEPANQFHFSERFHKVMSNTAAFTLRDIQNSMMSYKQSDEISFLLNDWKTHETQPWFGGNVQKIVSITAATVTPYFNYFWANEFADEDIGHLHVDDLPKFDARVFNVPFADVDNYFIWRQRDAMRNSVNFIARKYLSHKSLQDLNSLEIKEKLLVDCGVTWDDYPLWEQRGSCTLRHGDVDGALEYDNNIPVFAENREYITRFLKEKSE